MKVSISGFIEHPTFQTKWQWCISDLNDERQFVFCLNNECKNEK